MDKNFYLFDINNYAKLNYVKQFSKAECIKKCNKHFTMKQMTNAINNAFNFDEFWIVIK